MSDGIFHHRLKGAWQACRSQVDRAPEKHAGSKLTESLGFASIFARRPATLGISAGRGATLGALVAFSRLS
jgi:hypothetical protein